MRKGAGPGSEMLAAAPAVRCRLLEAAREQHFRTNTRLPRDLAAQPVIGRARVVIATGIALFRPLDHAPLVGLAADQRVDHWARDRCCFESPLRLSEGLAGLEYIAQQMIGWNVTHASRHQRVERHVVRPQPGAPGASPHRGLVDAGREPPRRGTGERSEISRPGNSVEISGHPLEARHREMTPEPWKRPIKNAREPWHAGLLPGERRTPPLVAAIQEPDADEAKLRGGCFDLGGVGRLRTLEPAPRSGIDQWQQ